LTSDVFRFFQELSIHYQGLMIQNDKVHV